jgi:hypothetical protein
VEIAIIYIAMKRSGTPAICLFCSKNAVWSRFEAVNRLFKGGRQTVQAAALSLLPINTGLRQSKCKTIFIIVLVGN